MQIIKQFTYEQPFMKRELDQYKLPAIITETAASSGIFSIRKNELIGVRKLMYIRSANQALAFSVPVSTSPPYSGNDN